MTGLTVQTTQIAEFSSSFGTPGDFDTATTTQRGVVKFYLPGAGVLFIDVGRAVFAEDPSFDLYSESGQHPFDQYSAVTPLCSSHSVRHSARPGPRH